MRTGTGDEIRKAELDTREYRHVASFPPCSLVLAPPSRVLTRTLALAGAGQQAGGDLDLRQRHLARRSRSHASALSFTHYPIPHTRILRAFAALCVSVGQLDDPPHVQGLAHFLEHMVFLGTEKYPEESNFDQFCSSCAGYSNAWTSLDHTMFHFLVSHSKLQPALDRFASFFSCPLLSPDGTDREIHAVDSENNKNLQDDERSAPRAAYARASY